MSDIDLSGRGAVVTGSTSGIGLEIARVGACWCQCDAERLWRF